MLSFVLAPDPIYKTRCSPVSAVNDEVRALLDEMLELLRQEHAIGLAAPMLGLTQRLIVVELTDEKGVAHSYQMANPVIKERSAETQTTEESSITFLGISAPVTRAQSVTVEYLDTQGALQTLQASGLLAACIQHEIDYLDGITILDHQPPMKRDMLRRKLEKEKRHFRPHVHGPNCNH